MIYWISVVLLFTIPSASPATLDSNGCPTQESMTINEMEPVGFVLLNIRNVNSVSISGNQPYFEIKKNTTTSQLVTKRKIDYEKGRGTQYLSVTIFVENTVDVRVIFSSKPYTTSMAEDIKSGSHVITVNINDIDANFPNWTLTGSQKFALVRKDRTSAIIGANGEFDYEKDPHTFNLTVFAEIPENKTLSGSAHVTVTLTDVDNLPPKFNQDVYKINVPENTKAGILDAKIHAYDQDSGINASVKYRTVYEDKTGPFRINETSGSIVITNGTAIDREKKDFYVILVQAYQVDKPATRTNAAVVEINITDVNDNAPTMSKNTYKVTIAENTPHNTPVIQVSAEDTDEGENKKFEFHMVSSNTAFVIDSTTGLISVNNTSLLDREQKNNFTLQVYAKETSTKEHRESSKSKVIITLTDENDNNPQFSLATYNFTIKKTAKIGEPIGKVNATDIDEGINGQVTYEFSSGDKDIYRFKLDSTSGSITVLHNLSSNFLPEYKFLLKAHDNAADKNKRRQSSATVFVTVENVNTQAPRFVPSDKVSVDVQEDARNGSFIAKITAEDPDLDSLTYSFSSTTNTAKLFLIDRSSGEIRLNGQLDREKAAQYDLTIRVFDGKFTTECILNVKVLDVNDNSPRFSRNYSFFTMEEQDNILVGQVNATDNDEGENKKISYRILEPWSVNFTIDNSGNIRTIGRLDRDILHSSGICELEVEAVDGGTPALTGECVVTVNVTDINDNGPQFLKENITLIFDELTTPKKFFTAQASDRDPESVIVYTIRQTHNVFTIDSRTGDLSALKKLTMEETDNGFFKVDIVAGNSRKYNDTSIHNATQHVIIELQDVNNHFPKFDSNEYSFTLPENKDLGLVCKLNATDADKSLKYNTVIYSITSGNEQDKFFIERSTGNLYLKRHLDYENTTKYNLTIKASDGQPNVEDGKVQGSSMSVTISVQNINDNRPVFTQESYECTAFEGSQQINCSKTIAATDLDNNSQEIKFKLLNNSLFTINSSTGILKTRSSAGLDYEIDPHRYELKVLAIDDNGISSTSLTGTCMVTLSLIDINDNKPTFVQPDGNNGLDVLENTGIGTFIYVLKATDKDSNTDLLYGLEDKTGSFQVNNKSGEIRLIRILDREKKAQINVTIQVFDGKHTTNSSLHVRVLDVNDNPPIFQSNYSFSAIEEKDSAVIGQVKATDNDEGENKKISYRILEPWSANFTIDNSGNISTIGRLDRDILHSSGICELEVEAVDGGTPALTGECVVTVNVTDINDNGPQFLKENITLIFDELTTPTKFFTAQATDKDPESVVIYKIQQTQNVFKIDNRTGELSAVKSLTMEESDNGFFQFDIVAGNNKKYHDSSIHNTTQHMKIELKDVNNHFPTFDLNKYCITLLENKDLGLVYTLNATDGDKSLKYNTVTYSITSGNEEDKFFIERSTGNLYLKRHLDYENTTKYSLTILASDNQPNAKDGKVYNSSTSLVITVHNVNDNPPVFTQESYECTAFEGSQQINCSKAIVATDLDNSALEIRYKLLNDSYFTVNNNTGILKTRKSAGLDYEVDPHRYELKILAIDDNGSSSTSLTGTCMVALNLIDVNDNPPMFVQPVGNKGVDVLENVGVGTIIFVLQATDKDSNPHLLYGLEDKTGSFQVNNKSGEIRLIRILDREIKAQINVTIQVFDGKHTTNSSLHVRVHDVNDNPPIFQSNYSFSAIEEKDSAVIGQVKATDNDEGENKKISYRILEPWSANFTIDNSGNISTIGRLDRDILHSSGICELEVEAVDGGTPALTGECVVTVNVTDINDNGPQFLKENITLIFDELTTPTKFFTAQATDKDPESVVIYKIQQTQNVFKIDNRTGELSAVKSLTMEESDNGFFQFDIVAGNNKKYHDSSIHNTTQHMKIELKDVNNHFPTFDLNKYSITLLENKDLGLVYTLNATDGDKSLKYNTVTYSITSGNEEDKFFIERSTGNLYLKRHLDYENTTKYSLTILASDNQPNAKDGKVYNSSTSLVITVHNVNDNPPVFTQESYECTAFEGSQQINCSKAIVATDLDNSPLEIRYKLLNDSYFTVNNNTGILKTRKSAGLDYEVDPHRYELKILAIDDNGSLSTSLTGTCMVTLNLIDVNDNPPMFVQPVGNKGVDVLENVGVGTIIFVLQATDKDSNPHLLYGLEDKTGSFQVNNKSGEIRLIRILDREIKAQINVTIQVFDGKHTTNSSLHVRVLDVNDNPPIFQSNYSFSAIEEKDSAVIGQVKATDNDEGENKKISYRILEPWSANFTIDNSGNISTIGRLDRDILHSSGICELEVEAVDGGTPALTGECLVTVNVTDINDNGPQFLKENITLIFDELTTPKKFFTAQASDRDPESVIVYTIRQTHNVFTIDNRTGDLSALKKLTMEETDNGFFRIDIVAGNSRKYNDTSIHDATQHVIIELQDVNNHSPTFDSNEYNFTLPENKDLGLVCKLNATDADKSLKYNTVIYSITSGNEQDKFFVERSTGNLYLKRYLDYENTTKYTLTIKASDGQPNVEDGKVPGSSTRVIISVQNINDNRPVFTQDEYFCSVDEGATNLKCDYSIHANDKDSGPYGEVTYSMENNYQHFDIDSSTGTISVKNESTLNFDVVKQYTLTITATDNDSNITARRHSKCTVVIRIEDQNNHAPTFTSPSGIGTAKVQENCENNTIVYVLQAIDRDTNDSLTYGLVNNSHYFHIDSKSGILTVRGSLDREEAAEYFVGVYVHDGNNHTTNGSIHILVMDVNDNAPEFEKLTYEFNVTEGTGNEHVGIVKASDSDKTPGLSIITYYTEPNNWMENFTVDQSTGEIKTQGTLDRERLSECDEQIIFTIIARDNGSPPFTGNASVYINVFDINDNAPYFLDDTINFSFRKHSKPVAFYTAEAFDDDCGMNAEIQFKIDDISQKFFHIDKTNGTLSATKDLTLRESPSSNGTYKIEITASNTATYEPGVVKNGPQIVVVQVEDENEYKPGFNSSSYSFDVSEDQKPGAKLFSVSAEDKDFSTEFNTVHYDIVDGDENDHFFIDRDAGSIFLISPLDYEKQTTFTFMVIAMDDAPPTLKHTSTATVTVHIRDVNDNNPIFSHDEYLCSVGEGTTNLYCDYPIYANDTDSGKCGVITYSMENNHQHFDIDSSTGTISVKNESTLNFDVVKKYTLTVTATDNDGNITTRRHSTCTVVIRIEDKNNQAPTFISPSSIDTAKVQENCENNTIVYVLQAFDTDTNDSLTYGLLNNSEYFHVNTESGILTVVGSLDMEVKPEFFIGVYVQDKKNHTTKESLHILVMDVNDNAPEFDKLTYVFNVTEGKGNEHVGTVTASDADKTLGPNNVTYHAESDNWTKNFTIDQRTGGIKTQGALDRERLSECDEMILFTILGRDNGSPPFTGNTSVYINVLDINDNEPYFLDDAKTFSFRKHSKPAAFYTAKAHDKDCGVNAEIRYEIDNISQTYFEIDESKGSLSATTNLTLRDSPSGNGTYRIEITAFNTAPYETGGLKNGSQIVVVQVEDENDFKPEFNLSTYSLNVSEDRKPGSELFSVSAEDKDFSTEFNTVHYDIVDGDKYDHFFIGRETGSIFLISPLDYEKQTKFTFMVIARDNAPPSLNHTSTATVTVHIIDVNDNSPVFSHDEYLCSVGEGTMNLHCDNPIYANDTDSGKYGDITYGMENNHQHFDIDSSTGTITVKNASTLNYDVVKQYTLTITATDNDDNITTRRHSTCTVVIRIEDKNNQAPTFTNPSGIDTAKVQENCENNTIVYVLQAFDTDTNDYLTYGLLNNSDFFHVNAESGILTVVGSLDMEVKPEFFIGVYVQDKKNHTTKESLHILVMDVNDNAPEFDKLTYVFNVTEGKGNEHVGTVTASDADKTLGPNNVTYHAESDNWTKNFTIDQRTGGIKTQGALDRERLSECDEMILFTILGRDNGSPPFTGNTSVYINVLDINDNEPYFLDDAKTFSFRKHSKPAAFYTAKAHDKDCGVNAEIRYEIDNISQTYFEIDESKGSLSATTNLTLRDSPSGNGTYRIEITAFNTAPYETGGLKNGSQIVVVQVEDENDFKPEFNLSTYSFNVSEDRKPGSELFSIIAKDNDVSAEFNTVQYDIDEKDKSDHFFIDKEAGAIYLISPLDYEKQSEFTFHVIARDNAPLSSKHTSTARVTVHVRDVNDNSPVFSHDKYICSVGEGTTNLICDYPIYANDTDSGIYGDITYSIENHYQHFDIDSSTGYISVKNESTLNFDVGKHYTLTVSATDNDGNITTRRHSTSTVVIRIEDKNNHAPTFIRPSGKDIEAQVQENCENNTIVYILQAYDGDTNDSLTYGLRNNFHTFYVDAKSGILSVVGTLDREQTAEYIVGLYVHDGNNHITNGSIRIRVIDVNDNAPKFEMQDYFFNVTEGKEQIIVGSVNASDADNPQGPIIYYANSDNWMENFTVDQNNGEIKTKGALDRERLSECDETIIFTIMARDDGSPPLTGNSSVYINVVDINDNAPYFLEQKNTFTFRKHSKPTNFYVAKAYDNDCRDNAEIRYSLDDISQTNFEIDPMNGQLSSIKNLTYKDTPSENGTYTIYVTAFNTEPYVDKDIKNATQEVTVQIEDINEAYPKFNQTHYTYTVSEDIEPLYLISNHSRISAHDNDVTSQYNTVTYGIKDYSLVKNFYLDKNTGNLYLVSPLDYEHKSSFSFTIFATDNQPNVLDGYIHEPNATVTVDVHNVNDNAPVFSNDFYSCSVVEGQSSVKCDPSINATDADASPYGNITYAMTDNENFSINALSGVISVSKQHMLDYDSGPVQYLLTVTAYDMTKTSPEALTGTTQVLIAVSDVNDEIPIFSKQIYRFKIEENGEPSMLVGEVQARDMDTDNLTYSLLENYPDFRVVIQTGELFARRTFDYESDGDRNFTLTVGVSDGANNSTASVIIDILNINDNDPVFKGTPYTADVYENVTIQDIIRVKAKDIDDLGNITYRLINTDEFEYAGLFSINTENGNVHVDNTNKTLDFETTNHLALVVEADDGGHPSRKARVTIDVYILNVNDAKPYFVMYDIEASIPEDQPIGSSVVTVFAEDPDTEPNHLTFRVENSTFFTFNGSLLETSKKLDCETQSIHAVGISVSDGVNTATTSIRITVLDVNDNDPEFTESNYNLTVSQNAKHGTCLTTLNATDKDISNDGFTFFLTKSGGIFEIVDDKVCIKTTEPLRANDTYSAVVNVIDHGQPPKLSSMPINLFINASNHFPPIFTTSSYSANISENVKTDNPIVTVTATDADAGKEGIIVYRIVNGPNSTFRINSTSGEITLKSSLDCEVKSSYTLYIEAKDKAADPMSATATVNVAVSNVNEPPQFQDITQSVCLNPPLAANQLIAEVKAIDIECPDNKQSKLFYGLLNGTSDFMINDSTGAIITTKKLTRINTVLEIFVQDEGGLNSTRTLQLSAGNNGEPVIQPTVLKVQFYENTTKDAEIARINATSSTSDAIYYSIINTTLPNWFSINKTTGVLTLKKQLDREKEGFNPIVLDIGATNSNGTCKSQVVINVLDINDNAPKFVPIATPIQLSENTATGTCVQNLSATDADLNSILNFALLNDSSHGFFCITPSAKTDVCITLNGTLDYDSMSNEHKYQLLVEVTDGTFNTTKQIDVEILDWNDNDPYFITSTGENFFNFTISEGKTVGSQVGVIQARDNDTVDQGKISFSLEGENATSFDIRNGILILKKKLDREEKSSYELIITAFDAAKHNASTHVFVTVEDTNDNAPVFSNSTYRFQCKEGLASLNYTMIISVSDKDIGKSGQAHFQIISGDNIEDFNISTLRDNEGMITVTRELDRDKEGNSNPVAVYSLQIAAIDEGQPPLSATASVVLSVTDINDCSPEFTTIPNEVPILEGSPVGFPVLTVTATDCDYAPENKNITYSLEGVDKEKFKIESHVENDYYVCDILLNDTIGIESTKDSYSITIMASDGPHEERKNLKIKVNDVNDHDPVFSSLIYNFTTPENDFSGSPQNSVVGYVNASDEDVGKNGDVSYKIASVDVSGLFSISENGSISVIGIVDRDEATCQRYTFTVIAQDGAEAKRTGYTEVVVYIEDVNDNSPVFNANKFIGNVKENARHGTEVVVHPEISASDKDEDLNGTKGIIYSLHGPDDHPFVVDGKTGKISVNESHELDREQKDVFSFMIMATDQLGKGRYTSANITIKLQDVNDETPEFLQDSYVFFVNESAATSTVVGSITATDRDLNGTESLSFAIISGSEGKFYIDRISGRLYVSGGLDREVKDVYNINASVSDGIHSNVTTIHIYLNDSNDNSPVFPADILKIYVSENLNATIPEQIYNITATDRDVGENAVISFSANKSVPEFNITASGELLLLMSLDREKCDGYTIPIYAVDHGIPELSTAATLEITVLDQNDNRPQFYNVEGHILHKATVTLLEKSPVGYTVFIPDVKDMDIGKNKEVHYSLFSEVNGVASFFNTNPHNGVVTIKRQIDLNTLAYGNFTTVQHSNDTEKAELELTLMATDGGSPSLSSSITLIVVIEGINDNAPVFLEPVYHFNVKENEKNGTNVGQVKAIVYNETNFHLSYSMIYQESVRNFTVHSLSGNITTTGVLDREKLNRVTFTIQVVDGKVPERTAYTLVEITVDDVNDNAPIFSNENYRCTIMENNNNSLPLTIRATDKDEGNNGLISYHLLNESDSDFVINSTSGVLTPVVGLDRETVPTVVLTVIASDHGMPSLSSTVFVTVTIGDENDNSPEFDTPTTIPTIKENSPPNTHVLQIQAHDPDDNLNGKVVYSLKPSDDASKFYMNALTGEITSVGELDYEKQPEYRLIVIAHDLGTPPKSSDLNITIRILDVYDTFPSFNQSLYETTVPASSRANVSVLTLNAGDRNIAYSITDGNKYQQFYIQRNTGIIFLNSSLTTGIQEYVLTILAWDKRQENLTDSTKVLVHVSGGNQTYAHKDVFKVSVMENLNVSTDSPLLIYDLNTTNEINGKIVQYSLVAVVPDASEMFSIDPENGLVYSHQTFDRELTATYELHIKEDVIDKYSRRKRRSFGDSPDEFILVVNVGDKNDNSPVFENNQQSRVLGIPAGAYAGDVIGIVTATDADSSDYSKIRYEISPESDRGLVYINPLNGELHMKRRLNADEIQARKTFNVTVIGTDENGQGLSGSVGVYLIVIPEVDTLLMVAPILHPDFRFRQDDLIGNLSNILGFKFELEKSGPHSDKNLIDPLRTDIYFHGINFTTKSVIPRDISERIIKSKLEEIAKLFDVDDIVVSNIPVEHSSNVITNSEIALIAIAVVILVGSILAVFAIQISWKSDKESESEDDKGNKPADKYKGNVDMWELQSLNSNTSDQNCGVTNPTYQETNFNANTISSSSAVVQQGGRSISRSSHAALNQAGAEGDDLCSYEVENEHPVLQSNADSGVEENESNSSNTGSLSSEQPDPGNRDRNMEDEGNLDIQASVAGGPAANVGANNNESDLTIPTMSSSQVDINTITISMDVGETDETDVSDIGEDAESEDSYDAASHKKGKQYLKRDSASNIYPCDTDQNNSAVLSATGDNTKFEIARNDSDDNVTHNTADDTADISAGDADTGGDDDDDHVHEESMMTSF